MVKCWAFTVGMFGFGATDDEHLFGLAMTGALVCGTGQRHQPMKRHLFLFPQSITGLRRSQTNALCITRRIVCSID